MVRTTMKRGHEVICGNIRRKIQFDQGSMIKSTHVLHPTLVSRPHSCLTTRSNPGTTFSFYSSLNKFILSDCMLGPFRGFYYVMTTGHRVAADTYMVVHRTHISAASMIRNIRWKTRLS